MVTTVSKKPVAVCAVRAVPRNRVSVVSLSTVEKTPESAMTAEPHTKRKTTRSSVGPAKNSGDAKQQVPLITSAATAAGGRPKRSDAHPPSRHPMVPATPIAPNAMNPVDPTAVSPRAARPATTNIGSQVHRA